MFSHISISRPGTTTNGFRWTPRCRTAWAGRHARLSDRSCPSRRNIPMLAQPQPQPNDPPPPPPPPPPPVPAPMPAPLPAPTLGRGWLRALLHGIREAGVQPNDPRVKALWQLLRRRQLLARSPWARSRLRFIWQKGLSARPRPNTIARLLALLRTRAQLIASPQRRQWAARRAAMPRPAMRRMQPVMVRRVATLRPVGRPVRQPVSRRRGR